MPFSFLIVCECMCNHILASFLSLEDRTDRIPNSPRVFLQNSDAFVEYFDVFCIFLYHLFSYLSFLDKFSDKSDKR